MLKFRLLIVLGNEAMQSPGDVAGKLREVADKLDHLDATRNSTGPGGHFETELVDRGVIRDINGNRVGSWVADEEVFVGDIGASPAERRVVDLARTIGQHWRDQQGVNGRLLDALAEATSDKAPRSFDPTAESHEIPDVSRIPIDLGRKR